MCKNRCKLTSQCVFCFFFKSAVVVLVSEPMALRSSLSPIPMPPPTGIGDMVRTRLTVALCCFAQISGADLQPELKPLPDPNVLMVEVENVPHDPFTVNEEVKVNLDALHKLHTHTHHHLMVKIKSMNMWSMCLQRNAPSPCCDVCRR